jgi:hypothetical protein
MLTSHAAQYAARGDNASCQAAPGAALSYRQTSPGAKRNNSFAQLPLSHRRLRLARQERQERQETQESRSHIPSMMMGMPSGRRFQGSAAKVCLKRSHQLLPKNVSRSRPCWSLGRYVPAASSCGSERVKPPYAGEQLVFDQSL